jgi:prophage regulatory protein
MNTSHETIQMLKLHELSKLIGLSRSSIYDRMNPKSARYDAHFPAPIKLGHSSRWLLTEVQIWIKSKTSSRDQVDSMS